MNNPLISIALTTYNGEMFLKKQLDSLYHQSYQNIEIVVSDDNSNDMTPDILKKYAKDKNLKVIFNDKTSGITKNFEKAIQKCSGEYVCLCDQDDIWHKDKVETLLNCIRKKEIDKNIPIIVHSESEIIDKNSNRTNKNLIGRAGNKKGLNNLLFGNPKVQGASSIINRKFCEEILPFPINLQIYDLYMSYFSDTLGQRYFIRRPLMKYRIHNNNAVGRLDENTSKIRKVLTKKILLYRKDEAETLTIFLEKYKNRLKKNDINLINDYFSLINFEKSYLRAMLLIIKNKFKSDNSVFKLLIKYSIISKPKKSIKIEG
jgi:glycosyltransferase involved in cell wall biosynthesis